MIGRLLSRFSPPPPPLSPEDLEGLKVSQELAYACAKDIFKELQEGWTEIQTARLMDVYLRDHGVRHVFHKSFAWFGERARFDGMSHWRDFLPANRRLKAGECVILDTAPIYRSYPADIGYPCALGPNKNLERGRALLAELRETIRGLFDSAGRGSGLTGGDICDAVARHIRGAGFDVSHHLYPGGVLGHRMHRLSEAWRPPTMTPFGWKAYARFLSRGVFGDLLNEDHRGDLTGAWAIEPHFGGKGFGCKFEELLLVDKAGARWLSPEAPW